MVSIPRITLNDGTSIPQFGLGVYHVPAEDTAALVRTALDMGYRHVDTAQGYGNEAGVGQGLRDAGLPGWSWPTVETRPPACAPSTSYACSVSHAR